MLNYQRVVLFPTKHWDFMGFRRGLLDLEDHPTSVSGMSSPTKKVNPRDKLNMGVSENSVPLHPMVNDQTIPIKWLFHWEYTLFSDKPI
jgi:hypothetical protein